MRKPCNGHWTTCPGRPLSCPTQDHISHSPSHCFLRMLGVSLKYGPIFANEMRAGVSVDDTTINVLVCPQSKASVPHFSSIHAVPMAPLSITKAVTSLAGRDPVWVSCLMQPAVCAGGKGGAGPGRLAGQGALPQPARRPAAAPPTKMHAQGRRGR